MIRAYENYFTAQADVLNRYLVRMNNATTLAVNQSEMEIGMLENKLASMVDKLMTQKEHDLILLTQKLEQLNPVRIMQMGWARATKNNQIIHSMDDVENGEEIKVELCDGVIDCLVQQKEKKNDI